MSNGNNIPKTNNGLGGVLTTLLKGNVSEKVQLLVVIVVSINAAMTKCNGTGIKNNTRELDLFRAQMSQQVGSLYDNQAFFYDFVDEVRVSQDKIQTKLGIEHKSVVLFPRTLLPDLRRLPMYPFEPYQQQPP